MSEQENMNTLLDTILPSEKYLENILQITITNEDKNENRIAIYMAGIAKIIQNNPLNYISFGAWWPAIKELLVSNGYTDFGQVIDSDVAQIYSYSRPELTILAAIIYRNERLDDHVLDDRYHYLEVMESALDTEPYLYYSSDMSIDKYQQH